MSKLSIPVILFGVFLASLSLFHKGLPPTHDGEYHIVRFYEFNKVLLNGNLYPRWAPDLNKGFGVPLFNYVYPFPNYVASFLKLFNLSFIDAFKVEMFLALLLGALFTYLWSREFWGELGGTVSSIFYTFSPYHFVDIYIRGSVGEVWALAFFPAYLWSVTKYIKGKQDPYFIISSLFFALIVFSHNILALMFLPLSICYILVFLIIDKKNKTSVLISFFTILCGIGISSIFWLPALIEKSYVVGLQVYDVKENFPEIYQLLIPSWGSGFFNSPLGSQMSVQIGVANIIVLLTAFTMEVFKKKKNTLIVFFLVVFAIAFLLMLDISYPIYKVVPLIGFFQFPWRLLSVVILVCSFVAGGVFYLLFDKRSKIVIYFFLIVFLTFPILFAISYTRLAYYLVREDSYYTTRQNFIDSTNSPGNAFNTKWFNSAENNKSRDKVKTKSVKVIVSSLKLESYRFILENPKNQTIKLNISYFPGWKVIGSNKREVKTFPDENGLLSFNLEKGKHELEVVFKNTPVRSVATAITAFSFISLLFFGIFLSNRKRFKV